jgi:hypothetical protein
MRTFKHEGLEGNQAKNKEWREENRGAIRDGFKA